MRGPDSFQKRRNEVEANVASGRPGLANPLQSRLGADEAETHVAADGTGLVNLLPGRLERVQRGPERLMNGLIFHNCGLGCWWGRSGDPKG